MSDSTIDEDRRVTPAMRAIFVEAYDLLSPFFDPATSWAGQTHEHLAYRMLHEKYPGLAADEVLVLVTAAKRVFSTRGKAVP